MTTDRIDDERLPAEGAADLEATQTDAGSLSDEERAEAAGIRAEIDETRVELGGTLNELGDRLEPGHLVHQATENVRDATIGRVEETAKGVSDMVIDTIRRNPIPAALAGAGLALLWKNRSNGNGHRDFARGSYPTGDYRPYAYGYGAGEYDRSRQEGPGIGQKAGQVAGTVGDTVSGAVGTVTESAGQAASTVAQGATQAADEVGWRLERFMKASPLAMGAIAAGAGAVVGSIIPETPQEQQLLGDASRQVADTVRQRVDDVSTQAEEVLDETDQQVSARAT